MHQIHMHKMSLLNHDVSVVEVNNELVINVGHDWWDYDDLKEAQGIAELLIQLSEQVLDLDDLRWLGFAIFKRVNSMKERSDDNL